jgi:hypothetical protein
VKPITNKVIRERTRAARTGKTSLYIVEPKIPAIAGPTIKPRLEDTAILPKFLLLFTSVETSARYALATDTLPPVIPSIDRAKNKTIKGIVITIAPKSGESMLKRFSMGRNNAKRKNIQPISVPP